MDMTIEQVRDSLNQMASQHTTVSTTCHVDAKQLFDAMFAIDAHLAQHAAMVAKLRDYCELVKSTEQMDKPYTPHEVIDGICDGVLAIINAEPAEPRTLSDFVNLPPADKQRVGLEVAEMATDMQRGAMVDIEAVREVIVVMRGIAEPEDNLLNKWINKLSAAIGA